MGARTLLLLLLAGCTPGGLDDAGLAALDVEALTRPATPLPRAHAHNDFEHPRPLLDALDQGFCSVEADVYLEGGELRVAHLPFQTSAARTLRGLYLEPLRRRIAANGGRVHPGQRTFTLLVDVKSDAEASYAALREVLSDYRELLTEFTADGAREGAVTVVLSGNRPRDALAAASRRWVALDGRLPDLEGDAPAALIPLISARWSSRFDWGGGGPMPAEERELLRELVRQTHAQGRRLRFWATPEDPAVWRALRDAGVDLIATDELSRLRAFLTASR